MEKLRGVAGTRCPVERCMMANGYRTDAMEKVSADGPMAMFTKVDGLMIYPMVKGA